MFHLSLVCKNVQQIVNSGPNLSIVRWLRKPRKPLWMPTAKSKMFRVHPRLEIPLEEELEIRRLYNNYRTQVRSVNAYLIAKYEAANKVEFDEEHLLKVFEEDFARCNEINQRWNEERKVEREERYAKELEEGIETAKQRIEEGKIADAEKLQKAEEIVRQQKEAAKTFITPEQLDQVIENAINNPVDYNFAIDLQGNRIYGRQTQYKPDEKEETQIEVKQ